VTLPSSKQVPGQTLSWDKFWLARRYAKTMLSTSTMSLSPVNSRPFGWDSCENSQQQ